MISLLKLDSNTIKGEKKEVLEEQKGLELEKVEEALDPYAMFIFAMNSPATQKKYTGRIIVMKLHCARMYPSSKSYGF
jgi:hypothetical protein